MVLTSRIAIEGRSHCERLRRRPLTFAYLPDTLITPLPR
jgi:hypothetical protein